MTKNLYYRTVLRRRNVIWEAILSFFLAFCSYPRLLLEVFIKRHFGERYFSFSSAVVMTFILAIIPFWMYRMVAFLNHSYSYDTDWWLFTKNFLTWYVFLAAFFYLCLQRRKEIKQMPSVYDFARFSLSSGIPTPLFANFMRNRGGGNVRTSEIWIEPAIFFVAGFVLLIFSQWIGLVLMLSSVFYSISYTAAYHNGDNFVMDKIDEMILNEEMEAAFIGNETADNARGVRFYMRKPTTEEARRKVADTFVEEDDDDVSEAK